ncbi:MAG TPA: NUDIX domain-containing protein, partial [Archangium sp.]|nr:NUDIX domain-containing protein [Archangium sp.]
PAKVRAAPKRMTLAVAVWAHEGRLLLARRAEKGLFGGLWELPAAEVQDETADPESAAKLAEALGTDISVRGHLGTVRRQLTHRSLSLRLLRVTGQQHPTRAPAFQELRWCTPGEASSLGMSTAMHKALEAAVTAGALRE